MQEFRLSAMEERNYGIDLLRIVSMMMVVLLHVLGQGGILDGSDPLTVKSETAWLLEIGAYSAVNIYAMISGYVGYGRKYKYSGLVYSGAFLHGAYYDYILHLPTGTGKSERETGTAVSFCLQYILVFYGVFLSRLFHTVFEHDAGAAGQSGVKEAFILFVSYIFHPADFVLRRFSTDQQRI